MVLPSVTFTDRKASGLVRTCSNIGPVDIYFSRSMSRSVPLVNQTWTIKPSTGLTSLTLTNSITYLKGSICLGVPFCWQIFQHSTSSSRCKSAHSKTRLCARDCLITRIDSVKVGRGVFPNIKIDRDTEKSTNTRHIYARTSVNNSLSSGSGLSSANFTAAFVVSTACFSMSSKSFSMSTPASFRLSLKRTIGSRC